MNVVVPQTAINASVSDLSLSVSVPETNISASVLSQNASVALSQTQINSSAQQGSGISVSLYQTPINVTVSPSGGGGGSGHDPVTIGTANGLSLSGQQLSLALSSAGTVGALSAADWTTFNSKLSDAPSNGQVYGRKDAAWVSITGTSGGGTSLPVVDTQTIVKGSSDPTKLLRFEVDGFSAGATRVLTPPNQDITLAGQNFPNVFTTTQTVVVPTTSQVGLTIQTSDNNETNPAWRVLNSLGVSITSLEADGILKLNNGLALPAFDAGAPDFAIKIVRVSGPSTSTGLYFQNKENSGYAEFTLLNDVETVFAMGIGGDGEVTGYDNVGYIYINSSGQFITLDATTSGQYIQFQTAAGVVARITEDGLFVDVIKSGATQAGAGAGAGEIWKTSGHATLPNNVVMIGV